MARRNPSGDVIWAEGGSYGNRPSSRQTSTWLALHEGIVWLLTSVPRKGRWKWKLKKRVPYNTKAPTPYKEETAGSMTQREWNPDEAKRWAETHYILDPLRALASLAEENPARRPGPKTWGRWKKQVGPYLDVWVYQGPTRVAAITLRVDGESCYNPMTGQIAAEVFSAFAMKGWGPLAYDFAALVTTNEFGMPLVSDRFTVSEDAKGVWDYYEEHRHDVPKADVSSGDWDCEPVSMRAPSFGIRMSVYNFSEYWGVDGMAWLKNKTKYEKKAKENRSDLAGRHIPEKYLAGLPPHLRAQRVAELTASREGKFGYRPLPTDIEAQKRGLVKRSRYIVEAEKRGIEHRGDYQDTAQRALRYYGAEPTPRNVSSVARELEKVFKKGLAAWQTGGHRPGASQGGWAYARVASVLVGGKAAFTADKKNVSKFPPEMRRGIKAERAWTKNNPRSTNVRLRVLRRNAVGPRGGFGVAEIVALSSYPGKGSVEDKEVKRKLLLAMQEAARQFRGSPYYNRADAYPLFDYQIAGVAYFLEQVAQGQRRAAIFDPMGLGKTPQGVAAAVSLAELPVMVVAPLSAHNAWRKTFAALSTFTVVERLPSPNDDSNCVYLVTYDAVRALAPREDKQPASYLVPRLVIFDEAHMIGNPESLQTRGSARLIGDARYTLLLTGTPALQSAFDVFPLLQLLEQGQSPFSTKTEARDHVEAWAADYGIPTTKMGSRLGLVSPEDGRFLERDLRKKAARRSRRSVVQAKAAPRQWLQALKQRRARLVPPSGRYAEVAQDKIEALRERVNEEGALEDFQALNTSINRYAHLLELLVPHASSKEDLFEKSKTAGLTTGRSPRLLTQFDDPDEVRHDVPYVAVLERARRAYLPIPAGDDDSEEMGLRQLMGLMMVEEAASIQEENPNTDLVFVVYYNTTAQSLGSALSRSDPRRKVYVYTGAKKGMYRNGTYRPGIAMPNDRAAFGKFSGKEVAKTEVARALEMLFAKRRGKGRSVILSSAAMTGLSLPSADKLIFLDRFSSPGLEDQMEDRINRAGRVGEPEITYLIPDDIWGYILAHRAANRRASIFSMFGERFTGITARSEKEASRVIGDDFATPLTLGSPRVGSDEPLKRQILDNVMFVEDPVGNLRRTAYAAYGRRRLQEQQQQEAERRAVEARRVAQSRQEIRGTPEMKRFLMAIGSKRLDLWVLDFRGREVRAVQPDWPEWNEDQIIGPQGHVIRIDGTPWANADVDEVESPSELTSAQRDFLLRAGYGTGKQNPRRRRRKRRSRWR